MTKRYYTCPIVGSGTWGDRYRPAIMDEALALKGRAGMIDLMDGTCYAYADTPVRLTGRGIKEIALSPLDLLAELVQKNLIRPDMDGKTRLYLGGRILGDAPVFRGGTITDDMTPQHTWSEPDGTTWAWSGVASCSGSVLENAYISDYAMTSADHYNQTTLKAFTHGGGVVTLVATMARFNGTAQASGGEWYYVGAADYGGGTYVWELGVFTGGSPSAIDSDATNPAVNDVMKVTVNGTSISGDINSGSITLSGTNGSVTSGSRVGLQYVGFDAGSTGSLDDLSASELGWGHSFNGVANTAIASINGVAIANIANVNGV